MTTTDPASMGGPLSEAERIAEIRARAELFNSADALWLLDKVDQLLTHNGVLVTEVRFQAERADGFRVERDAYKRAKEENDERFQLAAAEAREERDEATARVGVLEGQLATARALHKPERRYTPDDGETSYATYSEAADASFTGFGTPVSVTFFEVCSHCASLEMAEGCDHQHKESLWPCEEAVALGLDGGGSDA